jgi:hypothetical protein
MDLPPKQPLVPLPSSALARRTAVAFALLAAFAACAAADGVDDEDSYGSTDSALVKAGPCDGTAIDRAVKCAKAKGAHVLSFYRSPADQERVRRENQCTNRCVGSAGCVRPTAGCTTSPHTTCQSVDLMNDGLPLSRAALRACGLAKTTAPHANHYDLVN